MARSQRTIQKDAIHPYSVSYGKDELDRLVELGLHLDLKMHETKRLGLQKVRLEMLEYRTCELMLEIIRKVVHAYKAGG
jgi:hypothetical protein